ncbi:putative acyl-CoA thioester hydrolase [Entomohabitans teleogrylli]|uniref:putative acyl-CoA thioester hydrolase n=1 Tax=Entomohabitans teleogrylli TaxID=1384589 RepID=UPI00073D2CB0|nr:putative acyl-CoA thioester hydrolase [Entomohabitans teleogrylli]
MNTFSVSRLAMALTLGMALSACSSVPPEERPSEQVAPGSDARPVLTADEAQNFVAANYFSAVTPDMGPWRPSSIAIPQQADFVVGPPGTPGVTHTTIQAAVDAAIQKHTSQRMYIAILPGEYNGTVYIPAASGSLTLYGTGQSATDVRIGIALDSEVDAASWRHAVNPSGKYMPGKPAWYMYDNCQNRQTATIGMMCSAAFWSQNNGLQLQNMTIENSLGDSVDAGNHQAVALRSDGDQVQLNNVNILGRQNTFLVTNSDIQNRILKDRQTRTLVTNSYIEGDVDMVAGRGAVVFDNTDFRVVNSRTQQEGYVFAPATQANVSYGFLAVNSRFSAAGDGVAQLGRAWDIGDANGQVVIRDSVINEGFNIAHPWGTAKDSQRPFAGNIEPQRQLNDSRYNRMWEYNNRGLGTPQ